MLKEDFGQNVRYYRKEKKSTLEAAAELCDIIFGNCVQVVLCLSIINMPKKIPELWKHSQFHINDNLYRSLCFLGAFVAAVFVIYECLTIQMFQVIGILIYLCISCIYPALRAKYSNVEIHVSYEET